MKTEALARPLCRTRFHLIHACKFRKSLLMFFSYTNIKELSLYITDIMCNCLLKHVSEENVEVTKRRGRRGKLLLDDLEESRG